MKNYTLAIIAGLLMLSPVVASASFDTSLKYGARGQAVIELQDLLASEDCLSVNSTGYFGLLTLKAVKCFQTKYNLPSTGFFGVMSRAKANEIVANITASSDAAAQAETNTTTSNQSSTTEPKTFTLPNGIVIDSQGNIISPPPTNTNPTPATNPPSSVVSPILTETLKITSVSVSSTFTTMDFEWWTNKLSDSKVFISGGGMSSKVYSSESGLSTHHIVHISGLNGNTNYSYEVEAIAGAEDVKKQGSYSTKQINENASLKITSSCTSIFPGTYCDVEVAYFEAGQQKNISAITVSSNDNGQFVESSYPGVTCVGALAANSDGSQRKGNPLTCGTRPSPRDGKPIALFTYLPSASGTRVLTATANGATATANSQGQLAQCDGVIRGEGSCQL